jgi:predicted XRE-type DNA-binding protein
MKKLEYEEFANVWDAIADTPEEAANLTLRSDLMDKIEDLIKESGWTQAEAARHCGVTQPRINDLLRGRISRFSLDALVNIASLPAQRAPARVPQVSLLRPGKRRN